MSVKVVVASNVKGIIAYRERVIPRDGCLRKTDYPSSAALQMRSSEMTLLSAAMGGGIGLGYLAYHLLSTARAGRRSSSSSSNGSAAKEGYPMLDMAEIARRAVARKKSFLYTRSGDSGTSQVKYRMGKAIATDSPVTPPD